MLGPRHPPAGLPTAPLASGFPYPGTQMPPAPPSPGHAGGAAPCVCRRPCRRPACSLCLPTGQSRKPSTGSALRVVGHRGGISGCHGAVHAAVEWMARIRSTCPVPTLVQVQTMQAQPKARGLTNVPQEGVAAALVGVSPLRRQSKQVRSSTKYHPIKAVSVNHAVQSRALDSSTSAHSAARRIRNPLPTCTSPGMSAVTRRDPSSKVMVPSWGRTVVKA